ncbi:hypothetical protein K5N60_000247 [Vibrio parahaemolyticus]|nr:hypothetical protein [Vibrio parahaemolyticus]EHZ2779785.1 hypothetical protein [Vibrio parahaemolyticus]
MDPEQIIPRHENLKERVGLRMGRLMDYFDNNPNSAIQNRLLSSISDQDFAYTLRLAKYYLYLDEIGFLNNMGTQLNDPIIDTVLSKSFLQSEYDVLTRNLLFIPMLKQVGVDLEGIHFKTPVGDLSPSPLCILLSCLSKEERASRFVEFHPASHSLINQLSGQHKKWLQDHRQVITSYSTLISQLTGESYIEFEKASAVDLFKVLYLLVTTNQRYVLSIKPLLNSLDKKINEPIFNTAYDLSYSVKLSETLEKPISSKYFDARDKDNPNLTKAILNELVTYLLDACKLQTAHYIRSLPLQIQNVKDTLLKPCSTGFPDKIVLEIVTRKLERIYRPLYPLRPGKNLFEKLSLALIVKDIVNQLKSERDILLKTYSLFETDKLTYSHDVELIKQNPVIQRILKLNNTSRENDVYITKKQCANSLHHRQVLAFMGLHHYLKSIGRLPNTVDFDPLEAIPILLLVFDESTRKTKVPFSKNIPSSSDVGPSDTWNSLLNYSNIVIFSSDASLSKSVSHVMPYIHQLYWKERYEQVFQLHSSKDYHKYVHSKKASLEYLIDWHNNKLSLFLTT